MTNEPQAPASHVFPVGFAEFDDRVARSPVPVLVDFWAEWCGPCKTVAPVLERIAASYDGKLRIAKVDVDKEQTLAAGFNVRSIPTLILFKDGKVADQLVGAQPERIIRGMLDKHLEHASDGLRSEVQAAIADRDYARALAALEQAHEKEPANPGIRVDLARVHHRLGNLEAAREALESLPPDIEARAEVRSLRAELEFAAAAADAAPRETLEQRLAERPEDLGARYQLGVHQVQARDYEAAGQTFLEIMRREGSEGSEGSFRDQLGRRSLIALFDLLGNADERTQRLRRSMANLLH